ncbi:hypothetical protein D3C75_1073220 [compost metagenome]
MASSANQLGQLKVVQTLHHGLEHLRRHHIPHHPVVIEHCNRSTVGTVQYRRWIFLQFRDADGHVGQNTLHDKDLNSGLYSGLYLPPEQARIRNHTPTLSRFMHPLAPSGAAHPVDPPPPPNRRRRGFRRAKNLPGSCSRRRHPPGAVRVSTGNGWR